MYIRIHTGLLLLLILVVISVPVLPAFTVVAFSGNSFYVPNLFIYCDSESHCRHEVAHLMDHDLGDGSKTQLFGATIGAYLNGQFKYGESNIITDTIMTEPGLLYYSDLYAPTGLEAWSSPQQELYSDLYARVNGDLTALPGTFVQFYSDDPKYERIYQYLLVHKIIFFQ
jgi:hypothetical protein